MIEKKLKKEIKKWSKKLDKKLKKTKKNDKKGKKLLENARAYKNDSEHFEKEEKLIESFESLIWAWAHLEIGERLDHLVEKNNKK